MAAPVPEHMAEIRVLMYCIYFGLLELLKSNQITSLDPAAWVLSPFLGLVAA